MQMRITVRNLGVLKEEATIDLKPLTVFIGPNNSGKTWLAYTLAGIFGPYGLGKYIDAYTEKQTPNIFEQVKQAVEQVLAEGNATIDLKKLAEDYGEIYFNEVAKYARNWLSEFFNTQYTLFDDLDVSIRLVENKEQFLQQIRRLSQRSSIANGLLTIQKKRNESKVYAYTTIKEQNTDGQEEKIGESIPVEVVESSLVNFVLTALHRSLYPYVRVFPTERTTFAASRFSERIVDREQIQNFAKLRDAFTNLIKEFNVTELPVDDVVSGDVTGPIAAFLDMLQTTFRVGTKARANRLKDAETNLNIRQYTNLADILEKDILAGNIEFSTSEPESRREVLFHPLSNISLDMSIVSSMVKELSPLVLYLRYLAQPGELLIIDEPEMNLHPVAQVKIVEFLAMLVNAGLHVLITTHSTYVVDHLVNLIDAHKHNNQDEIVEIFLLESKDAFIDQEKVSAYLVDNGKVENILDDEGNIHWQTFSDVTKLVESIHFEL